jgi:hypothetical protein
MGTSIRSSGKDTVAIAASADSGTARTSRSVAWFTSQGGAEHARWVFDYDASSTDDDESGYRFGTHAFKPGEYVSIRDEDGELHTFRVASVEAA